MGQPKRQQTAGDWMILVLVAGLMFGGFVLKGALIGGLSLPGVLVAAGLATAAFAGVMIAAVAYARRSRPSPRP